MIRIAVIGAGHWGPNLIRNFHNHQSSEVAWVIDLDASRLSQVQARFPDIKVDSDHSLALKDETVDAVAIATPTSTHYAIGKAALEAGKHSLIEKPIAASATEGHELCEIAERMGLVLMVGHVFLYNSGVQKAKEWIDSGDLGRIYYISMVRTNLGPIRVDVNASWDLAAHDVSIANYWLGSAPTTVSAVGGTWINPGIEDAVFATLRYPQDLLVNMQVSWLSPRKIRDITVVGDRRMLTLEDVNLTEPLRIYDKGVTDERMTPGYIDTFASFRASVREGDIVIPRVPHSEPLQTECDHFVECVSKGQTPLTKGRDAVDIVRALEAIARSVESGGREEKVS